MNTHIAYAGSALVQAIHQNNPELVRTPLSQFAIHLQDKDGWTPLMVAALNNYDGSRNDIVKILDLAGGQLNFDAKCTTSGWLYIKFGLEKAGISVPQQLKAKCGIFACRAQPA